FPAGDALIELRDVHPGLLRVRLEPLRTRVRLAGEQHVVKLPELPLIEGAARRLVSLASAGMELIDGIVAEDQLDLVTVFRLQLLERWHHALAERTVEVRELHDR